MQSRTLIPLRAIGNAAHKGWHEVGTIFDGEQALFFAKIGACEPIDDECRAALGQTPEQQAEAQLAYRATAAGIWPEDMQAFREGKILGYDLDGNYLPGPNWQEPNPDEEDEDE